MRAEMLRQTPRTVKPQLDEGGEGKRSETRMRSRSMTRTAAVSVAALESRSGRLRTEEGN
ncbi:hypothetical protein C1I88_03010 [Akkermansia muciniphila]|nr:hypothetical protein C1I88_03010 [Akkermansia muciniphila]